MLEAKTFQNFFTAIRYPKSGFSMQPGQHWISVGSCFAQVLGQRLETTTCPGISNPLGILYNPLSICKTLERFLDPAPWRREELFCHDNIWHSPLLHSQFSHTDPLVVLERISQVQKQFLELLPKVEVFFLTLGTAWYWEHETWGVVSNCHKLPHQQFEQKLLPINQTISTLEKLTSLIQANTHKAHIVLTVSPIRHLRQNATENTQSKSTLLLACNQLAQAQGIEYFPAYEIMMDELRDYRFYKDGGTHPNAQAESHIIKHWMQHMASEELQKELLKNKTQHAHRQIIAGLG